MGAGPSEGDMLRVAFALLLSLGVVTPAAAQQGALIGNDSTGEQAKKLNRAHPYYQRGGEKGSGTCEKISKNAWLWQLE